MNSRKEFLLLEELVYNSRNIKIMFEKERISLIKMYGNKWLLCAIINGKLEVLDTDDDKGELESKGFNLPLNILFDVLNPTRPFRYKNYRLHNLEF